MKLKWKRSDRTGDWIAGSYECTHLYGRGGWSSWTVLKDGRYFGNWSHLSDAKKRAEADAAKAS